MKLKKIFVFIVMFFLSLALVGCNPFIKDIDRVERALMKFEENNSVDMDMKIQVNATGIGMTVDSKVIIKEIDSKTYTYMQMGEGDSSVKMYYVDNYVCVMTGGYVEVMETEGFSEENPVPSNFDFNFDEIDYEIEKETIDTNIVYTVVMNDADVKGLVEEILDQELVGMSFGVKLVLSVDKKTNDLTSLSMDIKMTQDEMVAKIIIDLKINALGDDVVLDIPQSVTKKIQDYIDNNPNPDPDPDPDPEPVKYIDTNDGVVKYYNIDNYKDIKFDSKTNKLLVLRNETIDIYNGTTLEKEKQITSLLAPYAIDADNGKMVVSYGTNQFRVYDLTTYSYEVKQTDYDYWGDYAQAYEIVIDGDTVIYADRDQSCYAIFYDLVSNKTIKKYGSLYRPLFTLNREDNILYITETDLSSSDLVYLSSKTGEEIYRSSFSEYWYTKNRIRFDGKYIHHEGKTHNRLTGISVSTSYLNRLYKSYSNFTPKETLHETDKVSFVGSVDVQNKVAIYDNNKDGFIYNFSLDYDLIKSMKDGYLYATTKGKSYIAIININKLDSNLIVEEEEEKPINTIVESSDGKYKTLHSSSYTKSLTDEKYIYILDENRQELNVYSIDGLELVHSKRFLLKPLSIDADNGKVVLGFGDARQFWIINTSDWTHELVSTFEPVFSTVIYEDIIYYAEIDQHCDVRYYNMTTKKHEILGYSGYYIGMAINRKDGVIYFGDTRSSGSDLTYYDLKERKIIFKTSVSYSSSNVAFDGNFIHYNKSTYDKQGIMVSKSDIARDYDGFRLMINPKTIYDNNNISVYCGVLNDEYKTVVYDLTTNQEIYSLNLKAVNAQYVDNYLIIFDGIQSIIKLDLN